MIELEQFLETLASEDEAERIYAAEDLGYANRAEAVPALLDRLRVEPSRAAREAIFGALRRIEGTAPVEGCLALLASEDSFLRNQAVELLRARGAEAAPLLLRLFSEGDGDQRKFVVDALAGFDRPAVAEIFRLALADPDPNVVITAVEALGAARRAEHRQQVEELVAPGRHPMLLGACLEALAGVGDGGTLALVRSRLGRVEMAGGWLGAPYVKLVGALGSPEDAGELAGLMAVPHLEAHAVNALAALRGRYPELALPPELAGRLRAYVGRCGSPLLVCEAVRLMGAFAHCPDVTGALERLAADTDDAIRAAARRALEPAGRPGAAVPEESA